MKDDELRAFLESATVSGDDEEKQAEQPAESTIVLPPTPAEQAAADRGLSFDDLIGQGPDSAGEGRPILLPGPPEGPSDRSRSVAASAGIEATVPIITPTARDLASHQPMEPQDPTEPPAWESEDFFPPTEPFAAAPLAAAAAVPARPDGAAHPNADYEKIAVTGGSSQRRHLMPWIIVAGGAVVALLVAFFIVSALSGGGSDSNEAGTTTPTQGGSESPSSGGSETTNNTPTPSTSPSASPTPTTPTTNVPSVEVGPTMNMPIAQWSTQVDLSQKLGDTFYQITGENLVLTSSLISSMPASCAGEWGMTQTGEGSFTVLKPQGGCTEAPELYDELWGLMDAMVQTARPL